MQFSINLLKQYLKTDKTDQEIVEKLTNLGLEVEEFKNYDELYKNIVIATILEVKSHPNAEKLSICQVNDGIEVVQIICGCSSVAPNMQIVLAKPGAFISADNFYIKKSKIRGEVSNGMICSLRELGLEEESEFIFNVTKYHLNSNHNQDNNQNNNYSGTDRIQNGLSFADYLKKYMQKSNLIELSITPNRGDCMSVFGIARDLSCANYGELIAINENKVLDLIDFDIKKQNIKIINHEANYFRDCYFVKIKNIKNHIKNPQIAKYLETAISELRIKNISPLVNITNYISEMLGNPCHVYSGNNIKGNLKVKQLDFENIVIYNKQHKDNSNAENDQVKSSHSQMKSSNNQAIIFEGLDNIKYNLRDQDIVIQDDYDNNVKGLAGIMGGKNSMSTVDDNEIIFELGVFESNTIAKTGQRLNLFSSARQKFERNVSCINQGEILEYALRLILTCCGGEIEQIIKYENINKKPDNIIEIELSKINSFMGQCIPKIEVESIIKDCGAEILEQKIINKSNIEISNGAVFKEESTKRSSERDIKESSERNAKELSEGDAKESSNNEEINNIIFKIKTPKHRQDIITEKDLIGEIGRLYGYEKIKTIAIAKNTSEYKETQTYHNIMSACGYDEIKGWSFISGKYDKYVKIDNMLKISNPISSNMEFLRPSAIISLLDTVQNSIKKITSNTLAFFEIGPVFSFDDKLNNFKKSTQSKFNSQETISLSASENKVNNNINNEINISPDSIIETIKISAIKQINSDIFNQNTQMQDILSDIKTIVPLSYFEQVLDGSNPLYFNYNSVAKILINKKTIGFIGKINPSLLSMFDIKLDLCYFEIDYEKIKYTKENILNIQPHPVAIRQFSFKVPYDFNINNFTQFKNKIFNFSISENNNEKSENNDTNKIVKNVEIFDIFEKNKEQYIGLKCWLQHSEKTLNDEQINAFQDFVIKISLEFNMLLTRDL